MLLDDFMLGAFGDDDDLLLDIFGAEGVLDAGAPEGVVTVGLLAGIDENGAPEVGIWGILLTLLASDTTLTWLFFGPPAYVPGLGAVSFGTVGALGDEDLLLFELALGSDGAPPPLGIFGSPGAPPPLGADGRPSLLIEGAPGVKPSAPPLIVVVPLLLRALTPMLPTLTPNALAVPAVLRARRALAA